jgi:hypothetical protein
VADYKGILYDLNEILIAYKQGTHENMPDFVAGSHDLGVHLQVPLLTFFFLLTFSFLLLLPFYYLSLCNRFHRNCMGEKKR